MLAWRVVGLRSALVGWAWHPAPSEAPARTLVAVAPLLAVGLSLPRRPPVRTPPPTRALSLGGGGGGGSGGDSPAYLVDWTKVKGSADVVRTLERMWELSTPAQQEGKGDEEAAPPPSTNLERLAKEGAMDWALNVLRSAPKDKGLSFLCLSVLDNFAEAAAASEMKYDKALVQKGGLTAVCNAAHHHIQSEDYAEVATHIMSLLLSAVDSGQVGLGTWLTHEGLGNLQEALEELGVTSPEDLLLLDPQELALLHLKPVERKKLERSVDGLRQKVDEHAQDVYPELKALPILMKAMEVHHANGDIVFCTVTALAAVLAQTKGVERFLETEAHAMLFKLMGSNADDNTFLYLTSALLANVAEKHAYEMSFANPVDMCVGILKHPAASDEDAFARLCCLSTLLQVLFVSPDHCERFWVVGGMHRAASILHRWDEDGLMEEDGTFPIDELQNLCTMLWNVSAHDECALELLTEAILQKLVFVMEATPGADELHTAIFETFQNLSEVDSAEVLDRAVRLHAGIPWMLSILSHHARSAIEAAREEQDAVQLTCEFAPVRAVIEALGHVAAMSVPRPRARGPAIEAPADEDVLHDFSPLDLDAVVRVAERPHLRVFPEVLVAAARALELCSAGKGDELASANVVERMLEVTMQLRRSQSPNSDVVRRALQTLQQRVNHASPHQG